MNNNDLQQAAVIIRQGGIVAFPTETYYGLAVDPFNDGALARLYEVKQRPIQKPLLTLIPSVEDITSLVAEVPTCLLPLVSLWPAPLTLVCPALSSLSSLLTADTSTVGVRLSPHPVARDFLVLLGHAITATSANISDHSPACSIAEVQAQFPTKIDFFLDGGSTPGGKGSTLVGCHNGQAMLLREGVLPSASLPVSLLSL